LADHELLITRSHAGPARVADGSRTQSAAGLADQRAAGEGAAPSAADPAHTESDPAGGARSLPRFRSVSSCTYGGRFGPASHRQGHELTRAAASAAGRMQPDRGGAGPLSGAE